MSDEDTSSAGTVDGTVLQEQIEICDGIIEGVVQSHQDPSKPADEDPYILVNELYQHVRTKSIDAFEDRFQTSALYASLKALLRKIAEERGYEHLMHYRDKGKDRVNDSIDNCVYWFKLYAAVALERQPEFTYEWAVPHFKEHRDLTVSHPAKIKPLSDGPEPTLVSSVVPLWYVLEDVLLLWREVLDMDPDERDEREAILEGEIGDDRLETFRYGFIRDLNHKDGNQDDGYITGYQTGEDGKGSRFTVADTDFFPSVGDIVRFQAKQKRDGNGREYSALTVTDTVTLVE